MVKETFIIYSSFYKPISLLSDKQLGRLFRAIFKYNLGEVVGVEDDIRMAFEFFKNQFEIDKSKYQAKVAKNSENGRKGGNPNFKKGQTNPYNKADGGVITEDNRTLPKITLNDNENVNENENEEEQKRDTDVSPENPDPINPDFPKKETHPPVAPPPPPKNPEKPKKAAPEFDMTNIPAEYIPSVQMWLDYKRGRGQTYKTQKSFELMVEQLQCFSRGDPKIAEMIVKQSMANNWAGLFELKNATTNGNSNRKNDEDFARELATVALEVEYEHLDRGRITEDEFRRRTGIEPVSRQYR